MKISPLAGARPAVYAGGYTPAYFAYYSEIPDATVITQRVAFGTSGYPPSFASLFQ